MASSNLDVWSRDSAGTGSEKLVKQLQQRLLGYRGISTNYDQILITTGAQNAIYLLGCLTAYLGRSVAVEDSCYPEACFIMNDDALTFVNTIKCSQCFKYRD